MRPPSASDSPACVPRVLPTCVALSATALGTRVWAELTQHLARSGPPTSDALRPASTADSDSISPVPLTRTEHEHGLQAQLRADVWRARALLTTTYSV
ncbi:hypothetical protein B0H10DRAFT_2227408 [Mycena sp. CBHHK59/15]|nr:hypothetical protein B0H10DRAFT_2227408 [Mycena sp. CBHHK59/15]